MATAHLAALSRVPSTDVRLALINTLAGLVRAGVVQGPIPASVIDSLVRNAEPNERVRLVLGLLEARASTPGFRLNLSDDLVALAIYEADPDQVNAFVFLVNWSPRVTEAIGAATSAGRKSKPRLPADLEILQWPDPTPVDATLIARPELIVSETDRARKVELVDAYQCLWAYGVFAVSLPAQTVAEAMDVVLTAEGLERFNRLVALCPDEVLEHPQVQAALDAAVRRGDGFAGPTQETVPGVTMPSQVATAPHAIVPPSDDTAAA